MRKLSINIMLAVLIVVSVGKSKFANAQVLNWASHISGNGETYPMKTSIDNWGNTYVGGWFTDDTLSFTTPSITLKGSNFLYRDGYLAKYRADGSVAWLKILGGAGMQVITTTTSDAQGNVYVAGINAGTINLNPGGIGGSITSNSSDIILAKYDSSGNYLWSRSFGGNQQEEPYSIYLDSLNNIYLSGQNYSDTVDFNPGGTGGLVTGSNHSKLFLLKLDSVGNFVWVHSLGKTSPSYQYSDHFAVSESGAAYIAGFAYVYGNNDIDFDPGPGVVTLTPTGSVIPSFRFFAKYNTDGSLAWVKDPGSVLVRGIAIGDSNNVYITGSFSGTVDLDFGLGISNFTAIGSSDIYLAKYSPSGEYIWARTMGGTSADLGEFVKTDKSGNPTVVGRYQGTANFNLTAFDTVTALGGYDIFFAKYDKNGAFRWARSVGGALADQAFGAAVGTSGQIAIHGQYTSFTKSNLTPRWIDVDPDPLDTLLFSGIEPMIPNGSSIPNNTDAFLINIACVDTTSSAISAELSCGEPYTLNGLTYTQAGIYTQVLPNGSGCDSTIELTLTYTPLEPVINVNVDTLSTTQAFSTYQWLKNGVLISGATNQKYQVTENADYQVVVSNENGCVDTSAVYTVTNQTAVDDTEGYDKAITIFPNPTTDVIFINTPIKIQVLLTTVDGRVLIVEDSPRAISLKNIDNGIYILKCTDAAGRLIRVEKVIKK